MTFRAFRCTCGHKLRFNSRLCGKCYEPTPIYNRSGFWWVVAVVPMVVAYLILR